MCCNCETYSLDGCCTDHTEIAVYIFTHLKTISSNFQMDAVLEGFIGHMTCQIRGKSDIQMYDVITNSNMRCESVIVRRLYWTY